MRENNEATSRVAQRSARNPYRHPARRLQVTANPVAHPLLTYLFVWSCWYLTMSASDLLDPNSQAYKKARRQFYKATKGRPPPSENDWTPFRAAEKKYKARFPPPDLSNVLDLAQLDSARSQEISQGVWKGSLDALEYSSLESSPTAFTIPDIPGAQVSLYKCNYQPIQDRPRYPPFLCVPS